MIVKEIKGNLFDNLESNKTIVICHICNNISKWGAGFVVPLGERFPDSKRIYKEGNQFLGNVTHYMNPKIGVKPKHLIFNMIAQNGLISKGNPKPIKYEVLVTCMRTVISKIYSFRSQGYDMDDIEFRIPKFGSGLAGGNWSVIKELINEIWVDYPVYVYYL